MTFYGTIMIFVVRQKGEPMDERLRPCPFCGMPYTELYWVTTEQHGNDTLGIFCNHCKQTVTLEENEWEGDTADTKRKAIKAWNRRAGEQNGQIRRGND